MDPKSVSEVQKQIRLLPSLKLNTGLGYTANVLSAESTYERLQAKPESSK